MLHYPTPNPGSDIVFAIRSVFWLTLSVTPSRQVVSGFLCNRKKGLTAAGTAQVSHLIPIYPIAFAAAKVQITEQNTKQKWIYFNKNLKNPLSEIDTLIRVF